MARKLRTRWARPALLLVAVLVLGGFVDVVPSDGGAPVGLANLTALVLANILTQGISKVLVFAVALVGLPWIVAGAALTASLLTSRR